MIDVNSYVKLSIKMPLARIVNYLTFYLCPPLKITIWESQEDYHFLNAEQIGSWTASYLAQLQNGTNELLETS